MAKADYAKDEGQKSMRDKDLHRRSAGTRFVGRLGSHHFAHLRATAEGIAVLDSARRYLGIEHGHEAITAHRQTADQVRAIARRRGDPAWRLIGMQIRTSDVGTRPSLDDFIAERDLDGWSEAEQQEFFEATYPLDRRAERRQRLRARQLELLRQVEISDAEQPLPGHRVDGWFDERTAAKLISAGWINLGQLAQAVAVGGRWFTPLPGIGKGKAQRIAHHLHTLIPAAAPPIQRLFALPSPALANHQLASLQADRTPADAAQQTLQLLPDSPAGDAGSMLSASTDLQAVQSWIQTHAGSAATVKAYWREARIFMLWLQRERGDIRFHQLKVEDCLAFRAFTENIPPAWISRARAKPGQPGWAPFRGPLAEASRHHLLNSVGALFAYLTLAHYLPQNPWPLIKTRAAMKRSAVNTIDTRAITLHAQAEILRFIDGRPHSPAGARMRFLVRFLTGVGLRASELLSARLADLHTVKGGVVLQVVGKGGQARAATVPPAALDALNDYLHVRGLGDLHAAPEQAPLLASAIDPMEPIGYQALYLTVRTWLGNAIRASALNEQERRAIQGVSSHWLRHTFATRAVEREVPLDVVQAQLGHANLNTTMNTYAKAPLQRRIDAISKAFG